MGYLGLLSRDCLRKFHFQLGCGGCADEFYFTGEGLIIDFEEKSDVITSKTMDKFLKYAIFASYRYGGRIYLVVLCHKDPKKEFEYFEYAPSLYIKVQYIHISQAELWARFQLPRPVGVVDCN